MNWFFIDESITDGERRQGPYSIDDIRDFVKQGKITDNTLVWRSGEESWKPWNSYEESKENETAHLEASRDELIRTTIEQLLREQASTRHYAGFIIRALAYTIDNCILGLFGGLLLFIMSLMGAVDLELIQQAAETYVSSPTSMDALDKFVSAPGMGLFLTIWSFFQAVYFIVFQAIYSATPGKKFCHIHIETAEGMRLSWLNSCARYLCSVLTQFTLVFYGLGYLIVCIDPKRRTLHDWIVRTFVVFDTRVKTTESSKPEQEN